VEPPECTVVVMTRDRLPELLRTLPRHEAPVLVVDNGSADGTVQALRRLRRTGVQGWEQVDVVGLGRNAGATARTTGARLARTPLVAFADDDSWWAPGALRHASRLFAEHPRLGLLTGRVLVGLEQTADPLDAELAGAPLGRAEDLPGPHVLGFLACAAVVRRQAFLDVGGFDDVVFFRGEEERVALDLTAAGWGCAYVPELVVHHHPSTRRDPTAVDTLTPRNHLLTAVMRRPWSVVSRRSWALASSGPVGRAALRQALPRFPAALRARRRLPADVERWAQRLDPVAG
jgi:GT2 family glycosyltransferase